MIVFIQPFVRFVLWIILEIILLILKIQDRLHLRVQSVECLFFFHSPNILYKQLLINQIFDFREYNTSICTKVSTPNIFMNIFMNIFKNGYNKYDRNKC